MEIAIKTKEPIYECFKLNDVSEETLKNLSDWMTRKFGFNPSITLLKTDALYINDRKRSSLLEQRENTVLEIKYLPIDSDNHVLVKVDVSKNEPIYCVVNRSGIDLFNQADFNKEFVEEKNNS